jgi:hypothetical protein
LKKKVVSQNTAIAIRLVDDKNDVFSKPRCDLYSTAVEKLPTDETKVDAHLRTFLNGKLEKLYGKTGTRREYANALLSDAADLKAKRTAYLAEMTIAYDTDTKKLLSAEGRSQLKARSQARKDAARAMFDRDANPMPVLHDEE